MGMGGTKDSGESFDAKKNRGCENSLIFINKKKADRQRIFFWEQRVLHPDIRWELRQ